MVTMLSFNTRSATRTASRFAVRQRAGDRNLQPCMATGMTMAMNSNAARTSASVKALAAFRDALRFRCELHNSNG